MKDLWVAVSTAVFLAFSYFTGGVPGLIAATIVAGFLLVSVLRPRFAAAFMYFFLGFTSGFIVALVIAHYITPRGVESALLFAFPVGGAALALWYGSKSGFTKWPVFGYRYRL